MKTSVSIEIVKAIGAFVCNAPQRTTTEAVLRHFSAQKGLAPRQIRAAIRELVEAEELCYSYELGCSFLQPSFNRPKKVSGRVVLTPPHHADKTIWPEVLVKLAPGAAFGYGQHPTTRLALKAIETAIDKWPELLMNPKARILDVGTGSGVLVIAAVLMGVKRGKGIDIDSCSITEARENISLNDLAHRISVDTTSFDSQSGVFSMITANLRYPTLKQISAGVARRIKRQGAFIVSGIKSNELNALAKTYASHGFKTQQKWNEKGWAAVLLQKE